MLLNFLFRPIIEAAVQEGGGGEEPLELETINGSAHQVGIAVDTTPRQTWHGFGWGANSALGGAGSATDLSLPRIQMFLDELTTDINATVIRFLTPRNISDYQYYADTWDVVNPNGIDTVFVSEFIHTSNPDGTATEVADALKTILDTRGVPASAVSLQNEPDGNPNNAIPGAAGTMVHAGNGAAVRARHVELRNRLDFNGMASTKVLGYEWRHPTVQGLAEFDQFEVDSLVSNGTIDGTCYHIYDKGPDNTYYDDRYLAAGGIGWSTETGNNGSPNCQARMLCGINHGSEVELIHYGIIPNQVPVGDQLGQSLLEWDGTPRPWYYGLKAISNALTRGTVIRLCTSDDRPPLLNALWAERMIRNPGATNGRTPKQQVIAGKRADNRWTVSAVSVCYGTDNFPDSPAFTDNHHGAQLQQLTVTIPELVGVDGTWTANRATDTGTESSETVNMVNGVLRFTLPSGDTLALVSDFTDP